MDGDALDLDCHAERRGGVTFVSATVRNPMTTPQMVGLESQLDGPVWPPRVGRSTAPAWDGDVWRATLEPGEVVGFGFASPADPVDEPLAVRTVQRAAAERERENTEAVLAGLDDWVPPRAAVDR